jgi:hypothetical protein
MREILVDRARKIRAAKRGAGVGEISLDEAIGLPHKKSVDLVRLDDALQQLGKLDERLCRIVELRFFAGLSLEETSVAMGISEAPYRVIGRRLASGFGTKWPGRQTNDARTMAAGQRNSARRNAENAGRPFRLSWTGVSDRSCASI